jgi:hypothetical protein
LPAAICSAAYSWCKDYLLQPSETIPNQTTNQRLPIIGDVVSFGAFIRVEKAVFAEFLAKEIDRVTIGKWDYC